LRNDRFLSVTKETCVTKHPEAIVRVSRDDLKPGSLALLFKRGAKAVILTGDPRVYQLWNGLFGAKTCSSNGDAEAKHHWEYSLLNMARNHRSGDMNLGEMLRFVPGSFAHSARKTIVFQGTDRQRLRTIPENYLNNNGGTILPQKLLRTAWDLMSQVISSASLDGPDDPAYAVAIEQLQYPSSAADLDKVLQLLADSGGKWTRIGQRLDAYKAVAMGPFDTKGLRDLFAWLSLIPGFRSLLHRANGSLKRLSHKNVCADLRVVGDPHVDGDKVLTALASDRDVLITEVYDGKRWLELPLSPDALAILPCKKMTKHRVAPTVHRILIKERTRTSALSKANVTLGLALIERGQFVRP
jgi:hypothetical protein